MQEKDATWEPIAIYCSFHISTLEDNICFEEEDMLGPYPNLPILGNLGSNVHAHFI
jgi:hypothetical protein